MELSRGFRRILDSVALDVFRGEFLTIVGGSGTGKTSLLRLLGGLTPASAGDIRFRGRPVNGPPEGVVVVFQDYSRALLQWRTVAANVALGLEGRLGTAALKERVERALEMVGLQHCAGDQPWQLSGGMQQRVQIARALINEPDILLMDEPFGALDYQTRLLMQKLLLRLWAHFRPTILFITHDVGEAIFISDRVIAMTRRPGRVKVAVEVHAPKPRDYEFIGSPEFTRLEHELLLAVQSEVEGREAEAAH